MIKTSMEKVNFCSNILVLYLRVISNSSSNNKQQTERFAFINMLMRNISVSRLTFVRHIRIAKSKARHTWKINAHFRLQNSTGSTDVKWKPVNGGLWQHFLSRKCKILHQLDKRDLLWDARTQSQIITPCNGDNSEDREEKVPTENVLPPPLKVCNSSLGKIPARDYVSSIDRAVHGEMEGMISYGWFEICSSILGSAECQ